MSVAVVYCCLAVVIKHHAAISEVRVDLVLPRAFATLLQ
jgi:hypothetical protein